MRIVQINCAYPNGSTGKIVSDIHDYLCKNNHESFVIFGFSDRKIKERNVIKAAPEVIRKMQSARARVTGFPYGGCIIGTYRIIRILDKLSPDVVHLHCINGYMVNIYKLLCYLKENNIPTILTLHAEFMYTSGCSYAVDCMKWVSGCYDCKRIGLEHPDSFFFDRTSYEWKKMNDSFKGFQKLVICPVSDWVKKRVMISPFFKGKEIETVLNGLNTAIFKFREQQGNRKRFHITAEQKVVIHVTPDFYGVMKGGKHVLEMAKRFEGENVTFFIVGAKEDTAFSLKNVRVIEHTSNQTELAQFYSMADVCLLTSVRETFSMVCAESLCCGTPIVGFKAGAPETISIPEYSEFVEQGDDDKLEAKLREFLLVNWNKSDISRKACEIYNRTRMCGEYFNKYEKIVK